MTEANKVLGQSLPPLQVMTAAYTVPPLKQAVISSIVICNKSVCEDSIRISVAVGGAADETKQYLYYDLVIDGNDTFIVTIGITLGASDVVMVYSKNGQTAFNLFGVEIT